MSWVVLAWSWRDVGASWRDLGASLGCLGPPFGANLALRRRPDGPSRAQDDHLNAISGAMLTILGGLGNGVCKNGYNRKSNDPTAILLHFGVLEALVGASWALFLAILVPSSAISANIGLKMDIFC